MSEYHFTSLHYAPSSSIPRLRIRREQFGEGGSGGGQGGNSPPALRGWGSTRTKRRAPPQHHFPPLIMNEVCSTLYPGMLWIETLQGEGQAPWWCDLTSGQRAAPLSRCPQWRTRLQAGGGCSEACPLGLSVGGTRSQRLSISEMLFRSHVIDPKLGLILLMLECL